MVKKILKNKEIQKDVILFILLSLMFMFGYLVIDSSNVEITEKSVPCYDKYDSEIQGLTCVEEIRKLSTNTYYILGVLLFTSIILIYLYVYLMELED